MAKRLNTEEFVSQLAEASVTKNVYNQYANDGSEANAVRRRNLSLYLGQVKKLKPTTMLIGEAPGHRGCRLTGIPLTSEAIMLGGVGELGLLGEDVGYRKTDEFPKPIREITATIVWQTLVGFNSPPLLLWNTFPFHPFQPGKPFSNRRPFKKEITSGQGYIDYLIKLFRIDTIIAMGNVADESLGEMGLEPLKVRHPAQGGKNQFVAGLRAIWGSYGKSGRKNIKIRA